MNSGTKQALVWALIVGGVIGLYNYTAIERFFILSKSEKVARILNLNNEISLIERCLRLNNRYTPGNQRKMKVHEVNMYGSPHLIVTFFGNNSRYPYSRCSVDISRRVPGYSFWNQDQYEGDTYYFCNDHEGNC